MEFTIYGLPGLYFETIFNVYRRWLNSMRHSASPLIASTLGSIIFFIALYVFVIRMGLDIKGIAMAYNVFGLSLIIAI